MKEIYDAYIVQPYTDAEGQTKSYWNKVGVAFPNSDGEGFNIDIIPGISVSGSFTIRKRKPKPEAQSQQPTPPSNYTP